MGAYLT